MLICETHHDKFRSAALPHAAFEDDQKNKRESSGVLAKDAQR